MPDYVLNRNHTLRTTNGVVSFVKGQPTWVIPMMERDAVGIGAQRVDGEGVELLDAEKPQAPQMSMDEREGQLFAAFDLLIETNDAKDFTGQGVPRVKSIERLTSMNVEQGEIIDAWHKHRQLKAEQ